MKSSLTLFTRFLVLAALAFCLFWRPAEPAAAAQEKPPAERPKFALLVGVNDYQSDTVPRLKGALNDVAGMKTALAEKFHVPDNAEHLRALTGPQATRRNILAALDDFLVTNAEKFRDQQPLIIFYFSGHGSHVTDTDHIETDNFDETIQRLIGLFE